MTQREKLTEWIKSKHAGQLIRLSGEPYFDHLNEVAELASPAFELGYEVGLCHDIFEKTEITPAALNQALNQFGYTTAEAEDIVGLVTELTNVFTKTAFPGLKKSLRKKQEDERLMTISSHGQTVKYADLIYNIRWMMKYDHKHGEKYLKRKQSLINSMKSGDKGLQTAIKASIQTSLLEFNNKMYYILYISSATVFIDQRTVDDILYISRENNKGLGITGVLLYNKNNFIQLLEGLKPQVQALYEKLKLDKRHSDITVISSGEIEERCFPEWRMGFQMVNQKDRNLNDFLETARVAAKNNDCELPVKLLQSFIKGI